MDQIARRHLSLLIEPGDSAVREVSGVQISSRDEEIWPCDARQLLDGLGVPRLIEATTGRLDW